MRDIIISDWLSQNGWASWHRTSIAGDASARRYERLTNAAGATVILMDAPPDLCGSQDRFVLMAAHLRTLGMNAPEVVLWDEALGLMILEDLGTIDVAAHLEKSPHDETDIYTAAVDALINLQSAPPPENLPVMTPDVGATMTDPAFEWAATDQSADLKTAIQTQLNDLLLQVDPQPSALSLRDFHAQNLIWQPEKMGCDRIGLLDFQDAFITHPTYDLASLLRDVRRDVNPSLVGPLVAKLEHAFPESTSTEHAFSVMAVQRNIRILGIFVRLAKTQAKTGYLSLIPRLASYLKIDLQAPIMTAIAPDIRRAFSDLDL